MNGESVDKVKIRVKRSSVVTPHIMNTDSCLEQHTGNNKLFIRFLDVTM